MIIKAQLEESRKDDNEMRLKTSIKDWQEMEPLVIKQQCHEIAEKTRQEAHGLLLEMKHKKPHKQFVSQQKMMTETRRQNKEQQEGHKMLNLEDSRRFRKIPN